MDEYQQGKHTYTHTHSLSYARTLTRKHSQPLSLVYTQSRTDIHPPRHPPTHPPAHTQTARATDLPGDGNGMFCLLLNVAPSFNLNSSKELSVTPSSGTVESRSICVCERERSSRTERDGHIYIFYLSAISQHYYYRHYYYYLSAISQYM